jgi:hypothetical protein
MSERLPLDFEVIQEEDRVDSRRLLKVGLASIVIGAIGVFFAGLIVASTAGSLRPSFAGPHGPRPAPVELSRIEQTPLGTAQRGIDLRNEQRRELETWGWVDRKAGIAKIPIERAMDVVAGEESR